MEFLGQSFQNLEHEKDRQTDRQTQMYIVHGLRCVNKGDLNTRRYPTSGARLEAAQLGADPK